MAEKRKTSVVVVGAGVFGGWAALYLLRLGAKVTLIDAWGPGNSRASSGGETRIIRATYGPLHLYSQMAVDALRLWKENQRRWQQKLFFHTGVLWMVGENDAYEQEAMKTLKQVGQPFEKLSTGEAAKRWPQVSFENVSWAMFEPEAVKVQTEAENLAEDTEKKNVIKKLKNVVLAGETDGGITERA